MKIEADVIHNTVPKAKYMYDVAVYLLMDDQETNSTLVT